MIARVPVDSFESPALGTWTVRMLVGHISRSFVTVIDYTARPAARQDIATSADYYLATANLVDPASVDERAARAADALGDRPADVIPDLRDRAVATAGSIGDPLIQTIAGGMRLSDYLPTRIFELAVHSIDLARATGQPDTLPAEVAFSAQALAAAIADRRGDAQTLLLALTGRAPLPAGFSVV
ncbi:hypothetical protein B1R94_24160 [Mycolicibacterium litorale]|nr:hypothetical protein B1R94_24160 [Mycolicibacterium litorale]